MPQSSTLAHESFPIAGGNAPVNAGQQPAYLRFAGLRIDEAFLFVGDHTSARPHTHRVRLRIKSGTRTYDTHYVDGAVEAGRVGVGDNPVVRRER